MSDIDSVVEAFEAASVVGLLTCACGMTHEIEYVPSDVDYHPSGIICACGREVVYGK